MNHNGCRGQFAPEMPGSGEWEARVTDGPSPLTGFLPPELAKLLDTAQKEITEHSNDHGLCCLCGSSFPCERAVLADLALSAF